jgi:hypothetical protein
VRRRKTELDVDVSVDRRPDSDGIQYDSLDVFVDASGGLILQVTETSGGSRELPRTGAHGAPVRRLAGVAGGVLSGSEAAFVRKGQLVTLQAGYSSAGKLQLDSGQLVRLARMAASR